MSSSRRSSTLIELRRFKDLGVRIAAVLIAFLFVGTLWHRNSAEETYSGRLDQGQPWKKFGNPELVDLGMHKGGLPLCERTMLVDWVRLDVVVVKSSVVFEKVS